MLAFVQHDAREAREKRERARKELTRRRRRRRKTTTTTTTSFTNISILYLYIKASAICSICFFFLFVLGHNRRSKPTHQQFNWSCCYCRFIVCVCVCRTDREEACLLRKYQRIACKCSVERWAIFIHFTCLLLLLLLLAVLFFIVTSQPENRHCCRFVHRRQGTHSCQWPPIAPRRATVPPIQGRFHSHTTSVAIARSSVHSSSPITLTDNILHNNAKIS